MTLCDGKSGEHGREHGDFCGHAEGDEFTWKCEYTGTFTHMATACSGLPEGTIINGDEVLTGHGPVVYTSDLSRYLAGLPVID